MPAKRIFLDANILVAVLCNEYPRFTACSRVLSLADDKRFEVYTSSLALSIGAHFAKKKNGEKAARKKIALLTEKLKITNTGADAVRQTLANPKITDLEDGFQYYSALDAGCTSIITYDKRDFSFAKVDVMDAEAFLYLHVVKG